MLTRMFAYFTIVCYLTVGTVVVRFVLPEMKQLQVSTTYLSLLSDASMASSGDEIVLQVPEMKFKPIANKAQKIAFNKVAIVNRVKLDYELHFEETLKVQKVFKLGDLDANHIALYKDFSFDERKEMIVATERKETIQDEVSLKVAASKQMISPEVSDNSKAMESSEVEPEYFDYPEKVNSQKQDNRTVASTDASKTIEINVGDSAPNADEKIESAEVADLLSPSIASASPNPVAEVEPEYFDYPEKVNSQKQDKKSAAQASPLVASFDTQKAEADVQKNIIPTVSSVSSQKKSTPPLPDNSKSNITPDAHFMNSLVSFQASLSIRALGTNLVTMEELQGFEVRFQDNLSETTEDFGAGEIKFETLLSQPKMTRSAVILKRGYIPTSTELILEEGAGSLSIPLIQEETLNDLVVEFERRGPVGSLLIELDDETEVAKLDVPFGKVIKLNGELKPTEGEDFRYQLFVGVRTGNSMISYHRSNGEVVNKILHIHENELTFDANFYEDVVNEKVRLYEEDLLAKESSPLIISEDQVKIFATNRKAKKVNNHTYKLNFNSSPLGGRRYLELSHQSEPVFVGLRENTTVTVPSENFMRFILSKVEGGKLGNRCLVQVNLPKKATRFEVAAESAGSSLVIYAQVLDRDGKFYDSMSDKSQKVIIIGEGQGAGDGSDDAKINVKIEFQDGTNQYLSSYCSPNTYLVEQL